MSPRRRSPRTPAPPTPAMTLRCYCCGAPIDPTDAFALVTLQTPTDRVFVLRVDHVARVDGTVHMVVRIRP